MDVTDKDGLFEVPAIVPGRYRAYAALGGDLIWANNHTITDVDPDFIAAFKERAIPVALEENGQTDARPHCPNPVGLVP